MNRFDVSRPWVILSETSIAAEELSFRIGCLRATASLSPEKPVVRPTAAAVGDEPIIVLTTEAAGNGRYFWRASDDRVEIYGEAPAGTLAGVFDFLSALDCDWTEIAAQTGNRRKSTDSRIKSANPAIGLSRDHDRGQIGLPGRRALIADADFLRNGDFLVRELARLGYGSLFLYTDRVISTWGSLSERLLRRRDRLIDLTERYGLHLEWGGFGLSQLVPRRLFPRRKELFRMAEGRRTADSNFCPTNPDTITVLKDQARRLFQAYPQFSVFHLWPDRGDGRSPSWCACPSCRAFTPAEQTMIAANAAADCLAAVRPRAQLSLLVPADQTEEETPLKLRPNIVRVYEIRSETEGNAAGDLSVGIPRLAEYDNIDGTFTLQPSCLRGPS